MKWRDYLHVLRAYHEATDAIIDIKEGSKEYVPPKGLEGFDSILSFKRETGGREVVLGNIVLFQDEDVKCNPALCKIGTTPKGDLYLERDTGEIVLFQASGAMLLGKFERFIDFYAFGEGYLLFIEGEEVDMWFEFLLETDAIPSE